MFASYPVNYEHPCLVHYRHLFGACVPPVAKRACTRGQETGEPGVSRRPIRFGGLRFELARGVVFRELPRQPYL